MIGILQPMRTSLLGRRIKAKLKEKKATQGWLAGKLELSDTAISKWISGESDPTYNNLLAIASILNCSVGYLCGDQPDDDVAAIAEIASHMSQQARKYYRTTGIALIEPTEQKNNGTK